MGALREATTRRARPSRRGDAIGAPPLAQLESNPMRVENDGSDDRFDTTETNRSSIPDARPTPVGGPVGPNLGSGIRALPPDDPERETRGLPSNVGSSRDLVGATGGAMRLRQPSGVKARREVRKRFSERLPGSIDWRQVAFAIVSRQPQLNRAQYAKQIKAVSQIIAQALTARRKAMTVKQFPANTDIERQVKQNMLEGYTNNFRQQISKLRG